MRAGARASAGLLAACCVLLAGCAGVARPSPAPQPAAPAHGQPVAIVHFVGDTNTEVAWNNKSANLQWGLLFSREDLVVVEERAAPGEPATLVNAPRRFDTEFLNLAATVSGIPNGQAKTLELEAGVYDWLVLIDIQGDGVIDGFLGTQAAQGPLSSFEFLAGRHYYIAVDRAGTLSFELEPDPAFGAEESAQATYLALMDSVGERLALIDDEVLREYVELVVAELSALRRVRGNHCYDMIHGENRRGVVHAYEALPPGLKVRESALVDRVLRSPTRQRVLLGDEEFLEAMEPVSRQLRRVHGNDAGILDDDERFEREKDLGCRVYRDLLAITLRMPVEEAAPIWRYMFSEPADEPGEEGGDNREEPVTRI